MSKDISTLVEDIYEVVEKGQEFSDEAIDELAKNIAEAVKSKFKPKTGEQRPEKLRPSNLGQKDRKVYLDVKRRPPEFKWEPYQLLNFFFGDMWEEVLLWLAEQAGHTVEAKQGKASMHGIVGSMDAKIDGHVVDVKTAIGMNFKKFSEGTLLTDPDKDPFGYRGQISFYSQADEGKSYSECTNDGYFLATDKSGNLALLQVHPLEQIDARKRVDDLREILSKDEPPEELCWEPVPEGKAGNIKLNTICQRCHHKKECFPEMRAFKYANGVKYYSHVEKEPRVPEIEVG